MAKGQQAQRLDTVAVSPFRCRIWEHHDRLEEGINEKTCRDEITSFEEHGQQSPVLGRPLRGNPDYEVELIFGARRLFIARHLNVPLTVSLREMSDREAIIAMDIENRLRRDLSPYERGLSYMRWLQAGLFRSQEDLVKELKISRAQVSRLLKVAKLPAIVVNAFGNPVDLREEWGLQLTELLEQEPSRASTIRQARAIVGLQRPPPAREVFRQLLAASVRGPKVRPKPHDQIVRDRQGRPLFRVHQQHRDIALFLPAERISAQCLQELTESVARIMMDHSNDMRASDAHPLKPTILQSLAPVAVDAG